MKENPQLRFIMIILVILVGLTGVVLLAQVTMLGGEATPSPSSSMAILSPGALSEA